MRISDRSSDMCSSDLTLSFPNHPKDEALGTREVPFSRELWIERGDFAEDTPKGWKRLVPGGEVRLRGAGIVRCDEVVKDADGNILELRGTLDHYYRPGMEGRSEEKTSELQSQMSISYAVYCLIEKYKEK